MEKKNIILKLRTERGMSQDELADKIMVTRQAVSRWENGDTVPNTDTLRLLSKEFDVSINTLLGEPRKLICQCCGMPIDDDSILGRDKDGTLNEEYCKWCYADGIFLKSEKTDSENTIFHPTNVLSFYYNRIKKVLGGQKQWGTNSYATRPASHIQRQAIYRDTFSTMFITSRESSMPQQRDSRHRNRWRAGKA